NVLGIFKMNGARSVVRLGSTNLLNGQPTRLLPNNMVDPDGFEQATLPLITGLGILSDGAALAAISKAGTAAFFSTQGSAISTRTASSIIQEFFPAGLPDNINGPLFGVQFSSLPCSDTRNPLVNGLPNLPLGLAGDPGGYPMYKNGLAVGGIGIEVDGLYSVDLSVQDRERNIEEDIAVAATRGYRIQRVFQADNLLVDGMRLEFTNVPQGQEDGPPAPAFGSLVGTVGTLLAPIRGQQISGFIPLTLGGVPGRVIRDPSPGVNLAGGVRRGFFPFVGSAVSNLTAADVGRILAQAAQQAYRMRAAIRIGPSAGLPAQPTEVNIAVVDLSGAVLGQFSTQDAPQFGQVVSIQKARTALFFSLPNALAQLNAANASVAGIVPGLDIAKYGAAATAFGVPLNGQFAFSSRAMGALARPYFPDGITVNTVNGPFSKDFRFWSPFNTGLQLALVKPALVRILTGGTPPSGVAFNCSPLQNDLIFGSGIMIFAGSTAIFKNGVLVGAVGVSGDGIDQDDAVAFAGAFGFEPPAAVRADQLVIRSVRLPYVKFPRHINIGNPPTPPVIRTS
ncbi:MAG TPA: heme-binding protein, partial [Blastocatellia bacterium]|nr:heme-binding protein [Blastocatellia bacterium]